MEPEKEDGNVEYKLKLLGKTAERIEGLASQMRYRCDEGGSECIYNLGVSDDGTMVGISDKDFEETIMTLNSAADTNNYTTTLLTTTPTEDGRNVYEVLVRENNDNSYIDIKVAVAGSVDSGKCLSPETPIIMSDGTTKQIKNVIVGDYVMGDDSTPRKVLKLYKGETDMYKVSQTLGDDYNVTENHILTLKFGLPRLRNYNCKFMVMSHDGKGNIIRKHFVDVTDAEQYLTTVKNYETLDISVLDYLNTSKLWKTFFLGYKAPVYFKEQKINMNPYLLGVWLGDGECSKPCITNIDKPILEEITKICDQNGWGFKKIGNGIEYSIGGTGNEITRSPNTRGVNCVQHGGLKNITSDRCTGKKKERTFSIAKYGYESAITLPKNYVDNIKNRTIITSNSFWDLIESYNLNTGKHIPPAFLYNTVGVRRSVLAGIIDSHGCLGKKNCYEIIQKNEKLSRDITYLARSLGLLVSFKEVTKRSTKSKPNHIGTYYSNCISGEGLEKIPVLLEGKKASVWKASVWKASVRPLMTTLKVSSIGLNSYNGFELNGNGRFLLGDFTVTHNSSTLSVLTNGKNDDGRGSARLAIFNFAHEVKSGRTSSIAHHILGFNSDGQVVNYRKVGKMSWPEIVQESSKIISFFDLAGHEKYLKTTILGLASAYPDLCFITVGANKGILRMTREHIFLCITLRIPFAIILTKIDMVEKRQNVLHETVATINKILKCPGVRRIPIKVNTHEDVILCAKNVASESIVPIFHTSNVTGAGIDNVKKFLNLLGRRDKNFDQASNHVEYHVDSTFTVAGVGTVTGGHLHSGTIKVGDKLLLGPRDSKYTKVTVRSIHCKRVSLQSVKSGSYVCLALNKVNRDSIRRGSVIISLKSHQLLTKTFTANVTVMKAHSTTIRVGYKPVVHASSIRQTAKLTAISIKKNGRASTKLVNDNVLRTGDNADVSFEFTSQPEYLKVGTRILLVEGRTKVVGVVV